MKDFLTKLLSDAVAGDRRSLGRLISAIEDSASNGNSDSGSLETLLPERSKTTSVIGVTGSPGAGKSTLVGKLASHYVASGKKVAILAVDPSSPKTGGAVLGDRIRMTQASSSKDVYIRSMATRGNLGGLAPGVSLSVRALDAAGFDYILVETVGVGQADVAISAVANTVIVVLVPGMGDEVQALKAGILEIADIFVINKSDYKGANRLEKELIGLLQLSPESDWTPPIVQTIANEGKNIEQLANNIELHRNRCDAGGRSSK